MTVPPPEASADRAARSLRVGVFGGTFDPPHRGHVTIAGGCAEALGLDRIVWVPAREPPHKLDEERAPAGARLAMVRAAVGERPGFEVSTVEIERAGPSYTVDTLRHFRAGWPEAELVLLMGVDQYAELHSWREPDELARLATLGVIDRYGRSVAPNAHLSSAIAERVVRVELAEVHVSSTEVRARVAAGRPIADLVPPAVAAIIAERGLYRD